jgi:ADP-heptose:LPS heptosyltransferase
MANRKRRDSGRSLLIFHQGALGDFVAVFPVMLQLRKKFPRIDVVCQLELGKLAESLSIADRYFPLEASWTASLFSDHPDTKITEITASYHTILLFSFSKILQRSVAKSTNSRVFRVTPRPEPEKRVHVADHVSQQLEKIGCFDPADKLLSAVSWPAAETSSPIFLGNKPKIILHPGSGSRRKCWPIQNFLTVWEKLEAMGLQPEFLLGPADSYLLEDIRKANGDWRQVHELSDTLSLLELLKASGGFIGNDSGVSHLAAFVGLPTVAVFGPSDPKRWTPTGRSVKIVRSESDCTPCFETQPGIYCAGTTCLKNTPPDAVVRAFQTLHVDFR